MNPSKEARTFRAIFARDFKMFTTYKASVVATILWPIPILALNIYQYLGLAPQEQVTAILSREYGVSSFSGMIVIGTIVYLLYNRLLWGTGNSLQQERWMGTIEHLFLTPTSRITILLASGFSSLIEGSWWIVGVFLLSWGLFGIEAHIAHPLLLLLVLISTMVALLAVGVFFASFFILTRGADLLATSLQAPIRFFSAVAFPVSALPHLLQFVAYTLPITYGIEALREVILAGRGILDLLAELSLLYFFAALLLAAGYFLVKILERRSKKDGSLHFH